MTNEIIKKVWVKLKQQHTHKRKICEEGEKIELREEQAEYLKKIGAAELTSAPKAQEQKEVSQA